MSSAYTLSLEPMANIMPLLERLHLLANFAFNKILPNESHLALPFIYELLSGNFPHCFFKILTDEFNNYNILRTDIYNLFKIPLGSQNFQVVIEVLPVRKSTIPAADARCRCSNLINAKWKHFFTHLRCKI